MTTMATKTELQQLSVLQTKLNAERRNLRAAEVELNATKIELEEARGEKIITNLAAAKKSVSRLATELDYVKQQLAEAVTGNVTGRWLMRRICRRRRPRRLICSGRLCRHERDPEGDDRCPFAAVTDPGAVRPDGLRGPRDAGDTAGWEASLETMTHLAYDRFWREQGEPG